MDGEQNGATQTQQDAQQQEIQQETQQQAQQEAQSGAGNEGASSADAAAYEAQLVERDGRIAELEEQIAEASRNAETAEALREEIASLKAQGESDRIDFQLQLAGCRNVKAARAVLADHSGDVEALKEAEPWMFGDAPQKQSGKTGLPNAGTAADEGKQMQRWETLAGLTDDDE